jgi:predicted exporter
MSHHTKESKNKFRRTSDQLQLEAFLINYMAENIDQMKADLESEEYASIPTEAQISTWLQREISKNAMQKRAGTFLASVERALTQESASKGYGVSEEFKAYIEPK